MHHNSLTLISSCDCNLSCKYCELSKYHKQANDLQINTINALKDNTFLNNVLKIYKYFNIDLNEITSIELWGQEPTLTLTYFGQNISKWLNNFPNWNSLTFSTNLGTNPQYLIDFILILEKNLTRFFTLNIQISYDGIWSCLNQRGIDPTLIKKHYEIIINTINQLSFNYLKINFNIHGVLTIDYINTYINDENELKLYIQDIDNTNTFFSNIITNLNCSFKNFTIDLQHPYYDGTKKDGQILTLFINKINFYAEELNIKNINKYFLERYLGNSCYLSNFTDLSLQLNDILTASINGINVFNIDAQQSIRSYMSCGTNTAGFKIMYDGTILNCLNNLFNTNKNNLDKLNLNEKNIYENLIDHDYFLNPLKTPNKNNEQKIISIYETLNESFLTTYSNVTNLMILLANCNQIEKDYLINKEKLYLHGIIIAHLFHCHYDNMITTGTHYLRYSGYIRLLCNGFLDCVDKYFILKNKG